MNIGEKIQDLMKKSNLNQKELAEKINITEAAMSKYIKNERTPRVDVLLNLSKELGVDIEYFLGEKVSDFAGLKSMVARQAKKLTVKEKMELMELLTSNK